MALKEVKDLDEFEFVDSLDAGIEGKFIELLVDTKKRKIFHVHPPTGHFKAAAEYLNKEEDELTKKNSGHLVSAMIQVKEKVLIHLAYGGRTSLENRLHEHHTTRQLGIAQLLLERLVKKSQLKNEIVVIGDIRKKEIVFK